MNKDYIIVGLLGNMQLSRVWNDKFPSSQNAIKLNQRPKPQ